MKSTFEMNLQQIQSGRVAPRRLSARAHSRTKCAAGQFRCTPQTLGAPLAGPASRAFSRSLLAIILAISMLNVGRAQPAITIVSTGDFAQKPIPVALQGFTGETLQVLQFDLYVQGFSFVGPESAQYLINGSDAGA